MKNSRRLTLDTPLGAASRWWAAVQQRAIAGQRAVTGRRAVLLILGLVLVLTLFLRLNPTLASDPPFFSVSGVDWDSGTHMNPDERHMTNVGATILRENGGFPLNPIQYFDTDQSPLNP